MGSKSGSGRELLVQRVVNAGLLSNVLLSLMKVTIGIAAGSRALLADGINSTSDVAYYVLVKIFTRLASKPADAEHPYGHQQMETVGALTVGAFVITTAAAIFWDSVNTTYLLITQENGAEPGLQHLTLGVVFFSIILKAILYLYSSKAGKLTGNAAVTALAYDHRNDIFASIGVAIGIGSGWIGLPWGDPLAGAAVAVIIAKTGIKIIRESSAELMDTIPGEELEKQVKKIVFDVKGVKVVEELSAHRYGPYLVINIIVGIDGSLSVREGDEIATDIERRLNSEIELVKRVYVHYHPAEI